MKYLEAYNFFNDTNLVDCINWNMISDIKDMSLEYIDDGCTLYIDIYKGFERSGYVNVCDVKYNHNINSIKYYEDNIFKNNSELTYHVYIGNGTNKHDGTNAIYTFELRDRLREAYPKEVFLK